MELSALPTERDSATLWRMVFELLGTMMGVGWQGFLIASLAPEGAAIEEQQRACECAQAVPATTRFLGLRLRDCL